MAHKVGMVHAVCSLVDMFNTLAREMVPEAELIHVVDEGLIKDALAQGQLTPRMARRLGLLCAFAEESGAELVMLSCTSFGPIVPEAQKQVSVPIVKVDQPMADEAVRAGRRIGVLATAPTTLGVTADLIRERAAAAGRQVEMDVVLCDGAFGALQRGDSATHDRIVLERLRALAGRVDVVALAQASMARVAAQLPDAERRVPVLSSPRLAMLHLKALLAGARLSR